VAGRLLGAILQRTPLGATARFVVACILAYGLDHYAEKLAAGGQYHPGLTQSVFNARGIYQYLVASWPRRLVPRVSPLSRC
jgi:hypothetical protein